MADETAFLNEGPVYVSNSKVVPHGTTYATANITSVSMGMKPASVGCALALIIVGAVFALAALAAATQGGPGIAALVLALSMVGGGIAWYRACKPTFRVVLASASGEREGLTSKDKSLVERVMAAISNAITHRG